jgi:hypothetical protein
MANPRIMFGRAVCGRLSEALPRRMTAIIHPHNR